MRTPCLKVGGRTQQKKLQLSPSIDRYNVVGYQKTNILVLKKCFPQVVMAGGGGRSCGENQKLY